MLTEKRLQKIKTVAAGRTQGIVVLEDIHDPHNAAAVLRTADAFGIQKVYFIQHQFSLKNATESMESMQQLKFTEKTQIDKTAAGFIFQRGTKFNPKKIGKATSSSANKWLDFEVFSSAKECFGKLKRQGYIIVSTVLDQKAKSIFKTKFTAKKIALCFGNEHSGLSQEAIKLSDEHIYIPMQGFVQSLNLSVTAALCMYELFRQRQKSATKYSLSKTEQNKLVKIWKTK